MKLPFRLCPVSPSLGRQAFARHGSVLAGLALAVAAPTPLALAQGAPESTAPAPPVEQTAEQPGEAPAPPPVAPPATASASAPADPSDPATPPIPPAAPAASPDAAAAPVGEGLEEGEALWGGLFWGGDQPYPGDPDAAEPPAAALTALRANPNTRSDHYALLGHDAGALPSVWFTWIRFSEEFFLRVERGGANARGELLVDVQLWQKDELLVSTAVILTEDRPLIIRGPAWRGGYLFATLLLDEAE